MAEECSGIPSIVNRLRRASRSMSGQSVEENLFANLSIGGDLNDILQQVDNLSHSLSPHSPDSQKLSKVLELTVTCAVRQTLIERELRALALTDDLTGLYNRRGFLVSATQQLKLVHRNSQHVLLFYCDLDNLKTINDSYGHVEGDQALIQVADALIETFRTSDIIARVGGDEFAVLALDTSDQHQQPILNRLSENLSKAGSSNVLYQLSLSVGVAKLDPREPVPLAQLMLQADEAMYGSKKARKRAIPQP